MFLRWKKSSIKESRFFSKRKRRRMNNCGNREMEEMEWIEYFGLKLRNNREESIFLSIKRKKGKRGEGIRILIYWDSRQVDEAKNSVRVFVKWWIIVFFDFLSVFWMNILWNWNIYKNMQWLNSFISEHSSWFFQYVVFSSFHLWYKQNNTINNSGFLCIFLFTTNLEFSQEQCLQSHFYLSIQMI